MKRTSFVNGVRESTRKREEVGVGPEEIADIATPRGNSAVSKCSRKCPE